jgi:hypothetical protein
MVAIEEGCESSELPITLRRMPHPSCLVVSKPNGTVHPGFPTFLQKFASQDWSRHRIAYRVSWLCMAVERHVWLDLKADTLGDVAP